MRRQHLHLTDLCHDLINIPDQTGAIVVKGLAIDSKRVAAGDLFLRLLAATKMVVTLLVILSRLVQRRL